MQIMTKNPQKINHHRSSAAQIKNLRAKLGMTQRQFTIFGFSESSIRAWESGKATPRAYAQNLLKVIAAHPHVVLNLVRQ
jgi:DNA-binding transcriptional regulator YiaG